jgi:hypothetical protein
MFAYDIVCLTYDIVCLFSGRRPAVPITMGPPPMLWAYGPKKILSFIQQLWRGMYHALWKRPGSNPGPWVPSGALWPLRYTPGIWAEPFDLWAHPVGLASGLASAPSHALGIWAVTVCASFRPSIGQAKVGNTVFPAVQNPEKMAIAARHAEGQWTHEVCRPQQWISDNLTVRIWVQLFLLFQPCMGLEEGHLDSCHIRCRRSPTIS